MLRSTGAAADRWLAGDAVDRWFAAASIGPVGEAASDLVREGNVTTGVRSPAQRRRDVLDALDRGDDVWVASASATGEAHLIPLSYWWDGQALTVATLVESATTRNLLRAGRARMTLPSTRDVVILDGPIEAIAIDADDALATAHADACGFDPRREPEAYLYLRMTPTRIQAWRDVAELKGRTILRDGRWLDG